MAGQVNPLDQLAIKNVIARYCEALDTKIFNLLDQVFVSDVKASYPFRPEMKGVDTIKDAIASRWVVCEDFHAYFDHSRLGPIRTHHDLTTQTIVFSQDGKTANSVTYFIGNHFGQGPHEGKLLSAYGQYVDELVCQDADGDFEGVFGASGKWRIRQRTVLFTQRIGDEKIMSEF